MYLCMRKISNFSRFCIYGGYLRIDNIWLFSLLTFVKVTSIFERSCKSWFSSLLYIFSVLNFIVFRGFLETNHESSHHKTHKIKWNLVHSKTIFIEKWRKPCFATFLEMTCRLHNSTSCGKENKAMLPIFKCINY